MCTFIYVKDFQQQCDFYKIKKSSKCLQTESQIETPERPPRKVDVTLHKNESKKICSMNILDNDQTNLECHRWSGDGSSDKDFYELKKLRLEAQKNISENNINDYSEPLLSDDLVDSLKIVLTLGDIPHVDELFKNTTLIDLLKFDVKELINKRLEDNYRFNDKNVKQDFTLQKKVVIIKNNYLVILNLNNEF